MVHASFDLNYTLRNGILFPFYFSYQIYTSHENYTVIILFYRLCTVSYIVKYRSELPITRVQHNIITIYLFFFFKCG